MKNVALMSIAKKALINLLTMVREVFIRNTPPTAAERVLLGAWIIFYEVWAKPKPHKK